jgi:hypothetical protein
VNFVTSFAAVVLRCPVMNLSLIFRCNKATKLPQQDAWQTSEAELLTIVANHYLIRGTKLGAFILQL